MWERGKIGSGHADWTFGVLEVGGAGFGFRVSGLGFRVWGWRSDLRMWGFLVRVWGAEPLSLGLGLERGLVEGQRKGV